MASKPRADSLADRGGTAQGALREGDKAMGLKPKLRRAKMIEYISSYGEASVEELAAAFDASPDTIRRDLNALAQAGEILKVQGGAKRNPSLVDGPFEQRMATNSTAKRMIAEKLSWWLEPDQTVFIDAGSTALICAQTIANSAGLRVITNSMRVAKACGESCEVFVLGGRYKDDAAKMVGPTTIEEIHRFQVDCALLSVSALSASGGASDYDFDAAQVARAMIARANQVVIAADSSKFDRSDVFTVCPLGRIDVLATEEPPGPALGQALAAANVELL
ncbi:MAG: DeoR/GlpR family DNA-binding transcription regulator [Pseudomonadota bacterium]